MSRKPNIIVCMCDQLRAFETGCYGNTVIRTPNIDRLAREGVRIETAVTPFPVCMAARSCLISGQYNRTCTGGVSNVTYPLPTGQNHFPQYPVAGRPHLTAQTFPEALRCTGYHTQAIGKWHIHSWPHEVGFNRYLIPRVHHVHSAQLFTEDGGPEFAAPGFSVDYEAERVEQFLKERSSNAQPFFLYYNISPPHCPVADAPENYLKMYKPAEMPVRANVDLSKPIPNQDEHMKVYRWDYKYYLLKLPHTLELPKPYGVRELMAEYYGLTTWVDDCVGRMLNALEQNGLAEDTIVIFTSDHGDNLGSHGKVQKGEPNEESARIPLVARWPGNIPAGTVVRQQVASLIDLFPTSLGLIGEGIPSHLHGQDLSPVLRGKREALPRDYAIVESGSGAAIRSTRFTYYHQFEPKTRSLRSQPTYLFDNEADPYQFKNVAGSTQFADISRTFETQLREWHTRTPWMD